MTMKALIDKLEAECFLSKEEYLSVIRSNDESILEYLFSRARAIKESVYGKDVFIRGLIEFTNYCKNDCYYCGIRRSNRCAQRYRLSEQEILDCCKSGYELGFRTFVLQGGEDPFFINDVIVDIIRNIKSHFPDCALTLSIGEKDHESYQKFFDAGADRYLLRHETADPVLYSSLHPSSLSWQHRVDCITDLKKIGFQTGCGFMVGSPGQTDEQLADELLFLKKINPHMVGIGPFIAHHDTPFRNEKNGSLKTTLKMLALIRLTLPAVLLPSTTALATIDPSGREKGLLAGANVVMPNLSPSDVRNKYLLYDNKANDEEEAAENLLRLKKQIETTGNHIVVSRGDNKQL